MSTFIAKYEHALEKKNTLLCVGLDPALPQQRNSNTIPQEYFHNCTNEEARLNFCLQIVDETAEFGIAAKPNEQYLRGFDTKQHQILADHIRKKGLLSIYDCKLGDIRDSAESAIYHFKQWGYDAITVNPLAGNLEELVKIANSTQPTLGLIVLTLMSNPEAEKYMKHARIAGHPVFVEIARDVKKFSADGCVVGATGHVTSKDMARIREEAGYDKVLLIPGVGTQKGDPEKVIKDGGKNILINVGRDIIFSKSPREKAREYMKLFNGIRSSVIS